jgi:hypothetical protein
MKSSRYTGFVDALTAAIYRSPPPGAPLGQGGPLGAEGGVLAVAGMELGVVGEPVEQLRRHVVDERLEVGLVPQMLPTPPGNGSVD